jgi:hypothetical protein
VITSAKPAARHPNKYHRQQGTCIPDDVLMIVEVLQEHDLTECPLHSISNQTERPSQQTRHIVICTWDGLLPNNSPSCCAPHPPGHLLRSGMHQKSSSKPLGCCFSCQQPSIQRRTPAGKQGTVRFAADSSCHLTAQMPLGLTPLPSFCSSEYFLSTWGSTSSSVEDISTP